MQAEARREVTLEDKYVATQGRIYLSGIQHQDNHHLALLC